jgi:hypothetical protein
VKRHPERGQRFNGIPYVDLGAARGTYMKVWKAKVDKLFQKLKDALPSRWNPGRYWRLIECVHDQVDRMLITECKHIFQAFCQNTVTRLILSVVMSKMKFG